MLKGLAIFGVLLIVFCANGRANQVQAKENNQNPATPVPAVPKQQQDTARFNGNKQQDIHADVKIVNPPEKDFYDKAPVWINLALVLAALLTLWTIKRQADLMKAQADSMADQLKEMRKVSEIENKTLILQYRPRIAFRNAVAKEFSAIVGQESECRLAFQVVNTGGSPAHIIGAKVSLLFADIEGEESVRFTESVQGTFSERTLQPGEREDFDDTLATNVTTDAEWVKFHQGQDSRLAVYLIGNIWYKDDLGIPRQNGIHRKYDPKARRFEADKDSEQEYSD